jgi:Collagen triple helix repeat (20 copies)
MATINNLPLLSTVVPSRVCIPVTCTAVPGVTYRLPLTTVISLGKGNVGYTGSGGATGPQGPQGLRGFSGSIGYAGSSGLQGVPGPSGSQGLMGYTGSAGSLGNVTVNLSTVTSSITPVNSNTYDLGAFNKSWKSVYAGEIYVNTGNIKDLQTGLPIQFVTSATTGGIGYSGSRGLTGSTGTVGYTGSVGPAGPAGIGYTGSIGIRGYDGSSAPSLLAGTGISFTTSGTAVTINATGFNNTGYSGSVGPAGSMGYAGSIGPVGYTGSSIGGAGTGYSGSVGPVGYAGSRGSTGTVGYTGSVGSVSALANGTYTISTLYVSTLTVSSVGAANIQSGNDLNLRAVGQITVNAPFVLTTATTSTLVSLSGITQRGAMVFVTDASGGAQPCYFDGVHWYTVNGRTQVA